MFRLYCLLIGYVFGCFQTAYVFTRRKRGQDIRKLGSGNSGTMNVAANFGKTAGLLTLVGDGLKTFAAIALCWLLFRQEGRELYTLWAGAGAVLGHNFPFWLRFRGGKGLAVTLAMLVVLNWRALAILLLAAALVYLVCRRLLMCTMTLIFCLPFLLWAQRFSWETVAVISVMNVLMLYMHKEDLRSPASVMEQLQEQGKITIVQSQETD